MNCAVHTEVPAVAYCRTCGKALCEQCRRDVRGVIYCEDCLAARMGHTLPAAAAASPGAAVQPAVPAAGPHPAVATVLAIFFPFGVPQVYMGEYAKGLAYMLIFAFLVGATSTGRGEPFFGIVLGFFYIFQIIDAYRCAKAIQMGQPAPDPFGITRTFGSGSSVAARSEAARIPATAVVLIGLGVLFLLHNLDILHFFWIGRLWPLILIVLGVWLFARRTGRIQ